MEKEANATPKEEATEETVEIQVSLIFNDFSCISVSEFRGWFTI